MTDDGETVRGLVSEPQMGPTEYKLSLIRGGKSEARMDQLTTQLLWRLQQSSPYVLLHIRPGSGWTHLLTRCEMMQLSR